MASATPAPGYSSISGQLHTVGYCCACGGGDSTAPHAPAIASAVVAAVTAAALAPTARPHRPNRRRRRRRPHRHPRCNGCARYGKGGRGLRRYISCHRESPRPLASRHAADAANIVTISVTAGSVIITAAIAVPATPTPQPCRATLPSLGNCVEGQAAMHWASQSGAFHPDRVPPRAATFESVSAITAVATCSAAAAGSTECAARSARYALLGSAG